jgi:D-beta-D-heptose 7-phosphate kinase/D-beta-D-heptose 1-phosphate adenosyltransferase
MYEKLLKALANLGSPNVLVVGDFMLDVYVYGDALRISPEAPVPVLKVCRTDYACGGAGLVAADVAALRGAAYCLGVIGNDRNGEILRKLLAEASVHTDGLFAADDDRPTISKQRLIGLAQHRHRQQLMRMDEESSEPLSDALYAGILESYEKLLPNADIVCLQDYNKGLLTADICSQMINLAAQSGKGVLVDPCLTRDFSKYTGASCITPNRKEASAAVGFEITSAEAAAQAAQRLADMLRIDAVVITLDRDGAYLKSGQTDEIVPTRPRSVYDVTGAGDTVLATLAVALAAGLDHKTAVQLANIAGGIEVEKFGAATVSIEEIINEIIADNRGKAGKVRALDDLLNELKWRRTQNQTVVFTNGCFDVVHRGHIEFLKFCKEQGHIVVVGLNSDHSVKAIKGPQRPINNQYDRAAVLAALETVDYIVVFDEPEPLNLIKKVKPNVLVKGQDWAEKGVVGRQFVESYGAKVVLAPLVAGKSSSSVIEKMKSLWKKF